jgi:hypothetical protein
MKVPTDVKFFIKKIRWHFSSVGKHRAGCHRFGCGYAALRLGVFALKNLMAWIRLGQ